MSIIQYIDRSAPFPLFGPEAEALFAEFSTDPGYARKLAYSDFIASLKTAGVWAKFDFLYVLAAHDEQAAGLNLVDPANYTLVKTGTPTFTANEGFTGNGTDAKLATGFNAATAVGANLTGASSHLGLWVLDNQTNALFYDIGNNSGSEVAHKINTQNGANTSRGGLGNNTGGAGLVTLFGNGGTSAGHTVWTRPGDMANRFYKNGAFASQSTDRGAGTVLNGEFSLLASGSQFSGRQLALAHGGAGLTDAEVLALYEAAEVLLGAILPFDVSGLWAGALTENSFVAAADIEQGAVPVAAGTKARLVVTTDADTDFADPVFTSAEQALTATGDFYPVKAQATGLAPDTAYRYRIEVNGQPAGEVGTLRTPRASGAFRFAFGSCNRFSQGQTTDVEAIEALAAEDTLFFIHLGDLTYEDYTGTDIDTKRAQFTRRWRSVPAVDALNRVMPTVYTFDDHDASGDDGHWDSSYAGTTYADVLARSRQVYRETVPHYPFMDSGVDPLIAQQFDVGTCRFIMPDCRSQARYAVGTPTCLGHDAGHESWDQFSALVAAVEQAVADGVTLVFLVVSRAWTAASLDAWGHRWSAERAALCEALAAIPGVPPIIMLCGDSHQCAADDGTNTDFSTSGLKIVQFVSSPIRSNVLSYAGPFAWNGADGDMLNFDKAYALVEVDAANENVIVTFKECGTTGAPQVIGTYSTGDLAGW